jgi:hypothetical protein
MKKIVLAVFALGLAAAAVVIETVPDRRTSLAALPEASTFAAPAHARAASLHPSLSTTDTPSAVRSAAPLREILPSVNEPVRNWREFNPTHLTIALAPDAALEFERVSTHESGARGEYRVWTGRNPDLPGAALIGVGYDGGWSGTLSLPDTREYEITIAGDQIAVVPKLSGPCALTVAMAQAAQSVLDAPSTGVARATAANPAVVDVLFFYNDEVVQRYGADAVQRSVEVTALSQIERANQILQQSKIDTLQWRFVAAEKVPAYAKPSAIEQDLRMFAVANNAVGQFVQSRLVALGADQAVLYIGDRRADSGNTVGIANTPGHHSVVLIQANSLATAHEMAHNFGCMHDRQTDSVSDRDTRYYFGYRFLYRNRDCGTVMSYASNLVPYFSNPDVQIDSGAIVLGTADKITIGVPEGEPQAADNARWLRERADAMAATRTSTEAPRITSQPTGASLRVDDTIRLSVTATGSDLVYQWQKDGATIAGATGSTYTKANAQLGDAGGYSVVVSNRIGSVTSSNATISIAAASTDPNPPLSGSGGGSGSDGGGGGGGGALSDWALAALAVLGALRLWQNHLKPAATPKSL